VVRNAGNVTDVTTGLCEVCKQPVNQNAEVHVRAGVVHYFADGKMCDYKVWHLRCWDPSIPDYNPADDAPPEFRP
jgi:hypothetical protein